MKHLLLFLFTAFLLTGCSSGTYTKIDEEQPFIATVNIKDTSVTFLNTSYKKIAHWDLDIPFIGALLLRDQDTLLLYGKEMDSVEVFSLSKGKKMDSWKVDKGIVNMKLLQDQRTVVALNQSLNTVSFYNEKGQMEDSVKVGKGPLTLLQGNQQLYVINFHDIKLSVINVKTRKVDKEFQIHAASTGALFREESQEIWIGGHGKGAEIEENIHIYSIKTGELKRVVKAPSMPVNFVEHQSGIFILSHGSNVLYKMDEHEQIVNRIQVGVNPFDIMIFQDDLLLASYDSDEIYVIDTETVKIKKKLKVGEGPFQMFSRE